MNVRISTSTAAPGRTETDTAPILFAAAVYGPDTPENEALVHFVETLKASGVSVAGLLQQKIMNSDGSKNRIEAIDIATGRRFVINKPAAVKRPAGECSLDVSALAESTSVIRKAIKDNPDLIIVEKFGAEEQKGGGLADEILQVVAAGIPLLVAVPEQALDIWQERTGSLGGYLPFDSASFREWWREIGKG